MEKRIASVLDLDVVANGDNEETDPLEFEYVDGAFRGIQCTVERQVSVEAYDALLKLGCILSTNGSGCTVVRHARSRPPLIRVSVALEWINWLCMSCLAALAAMYALERASHN